MTSLQPEPLNPEWTVNTAELRLRNLGPPARHLIVSTPQAGGRLSANVLRAPENKTLKGLTGVGQPGRYRHRADLGDLITG